MHDWTLWHKVGAQLAKEHQACDVNGHKQQARSPVSQCAKQKSHQEWQGQSP